MYGRDGDNEYVRSINELCLRVYDRRGRRCCWLIYTDDVYISS